LISCKRSVERSWFPIRKDACGFVIGHPKEVNPLRNAIGFSENYHLTMYSNLLPWEAPLLNH
jgi:hypothetical protein